MLNIILLFSARLDLLCICTSIFSLRILLFSSQVEVWGGDTSMNMNLLNVSLRISLCFWLVLFVGEHSGCVVQGKFLVSQEFEA